MQESVHIYADSNDSLQYFPGNKGTFFRVKLSEPLRFTGKWEATLTSLTVISNETDVQSTLAGQVVEVSSNVIGLSIVGGSKKQLLRRLNLGSPVIGTGSRTIFHVDTVQNCCFFKSVILQECSVIEFGLAHHSLYITDLLEECRTYASVYLKRCDKPL